MQRPPKFAVPRYAFLTVALLGALLTVCRGQTPTDPTRPEAQFLQGVKATGVRCMNMAFADQYATAIYTCGEDGIVCFKREMETGKLSCLGGIGPMRCYGFAIRFAGGRLYAVTPHSGTKKMDWHGLAWFDIDATTGKPAAKGTVDCPPCRQMIVGPDQKDLYLKTIDQTQIKILWYRIGADGVPAKAGEVAGKGIGGTGYDTCEGIFRLSADGKNIYCISANDHAIACIDRKPSGEITYRTSVDLRAVAPPDPDNYQYQWMTLAISGDDKWLYADLWNGKPSENVYGIFKRDADSGALTMQAAITGDKDKLANLRAWNLVFSPSGRGAYLGSWNSPLVTVKYDARTGHLSDPMVIKETDGYASSNLLLDSENGFLYGGGPHDNFTNLDALFVLKADRKARDK